MQVFTGRPARGLVNQATNDLQQVQEQLPLSLIGVVSVRVLCGRLSLCTYEHKICMELAGATDDALPCKYVAYTAWQGRVVP